MEESSGLINKGVYTSQGYGVNVINCRSRLIEKCKIDEKQLAIQQRVGPLPVVATLTPMGYGAGLRGKEYWFGVLLKIGPESEVVMRSTTATRLRSRDNHVSKIYLPLW